MLRACLFWNSLSVPARTSAVIACTSGHLRHVSQTMSRWLDRMCQAAAASGMDADKDVMDKKKKLVGQPLLWENGQYPRLRARLQFPDFGDKGNNTPRVPNQWREECDVDAVPFQPRFILQEPLFAQCAYLQRP